MIELDDLTLNLIQETLRRSATKSQAENTAIWFSDGDQLTPIIGTGPHIEDFLGSFSQPLSEGLISLVFASGQAICENAIASNPQHSRKLDGKLGITTDAMIALPLHANGETIGIISCVHTRPAESAQEADSFGPADLAEFEFAEACISRFIEAALISDH